MEKIGKKTEKNGIRDKKGLYAKGNPGGPGRPAGSYSIVELIKKKLQEHPEGKDKTYGEYFVEKIMKKIAVDEDVSMMKDIINRVDGLPRQSIGIDGGLDANNQPLPLLGGSSNKIIETNGKNNDSNQ